MSAFEPGSVQKSITFAAALQSHVITPQTVIDVPDSIRMGGVTVRDAWYHSTQPFTATGILAESSNVGTLKIAQLLGRRTWYHYEKAFGVGVKTGIELPGESSGWVPPL
jgi:cell division protein FtsI (penicillin-binding protein 3)